MKGKLREHLTYANVVATIGLVIALGLGSAWAASLSKNSVGPKQISKNAVKAPEIAKNAVRSPEIRAGAVGTAEVADASLLGEDFAPGQLPAGQQGPPGERGAQGPPGPTEGFGTDSVSGNLPSEQLVDIDSFTTTRAGRLFIAKPVSQVRADCDTGPYRLWLEIRTDGVDTRVPGSVVDSIADNVTLYGLHLSGVTSASVPAGDHEVLVRADCQVGTIQTLAAQSASGVSAIVLGG